MADLIAIGYKDEATAEAAADEARRRAKDLTIDRDAIVVIVRDSALFLMVDKISPDKAVDALSQYGGTVLTSSLSEEGERELRDALHGG